MKLLAVLLTALAIGCVGGEKANVTVVLKCKRAFYAKVQLKEIDGGAYFRDDEFAEPLEHKRNNWQNEVHFQFSGEASDPYLLIRDGVEPRLVIKHTCEGPEDWICKDYGTIYGDFKLNEVVNLSDPEGFKQKGYYNCASRYEFWARPNGPAPDKMA